MLSPANLQTFRLLIYIFKEREVERTLTHASTFRCNIRAVSLTPRPSSVEHVGPERAGESVCLESSEDGKELSDGRLHSFLARDAAQLRAGAFRELKQ